MRFIGNEWQTQAKKEGPALGIAMAVIGGVSSIMSGRAAEKAAKQQAAEAERMARQNAANIEAETMEQKRKAERAAEEQMAESRAKAAASGVQSDAGSFDIFLGSEEDKFKSDIDWLIKSGYSQADLARQQGMSAASSLRSQGKAAAKQGLTKGLTSFASAGMGAYNAGMFGSSTSNIVGSSGLMTGTQGSTSFLGNVSAPDPYASFKW